MNVDLKIILFFFLFGCNVFNRADITTSKAVDLEIDFGLQLISPASSPGVSQTPTIRISNVRAGDDVKIYTDSGCTQEVSNGLASSSTIDLTTSPLNSDVYRFYAKSFNSASGNSVCSRRSVGYEILPHINSVTLPPNASYGDLRMLNFTVTFSEPVIITGLPRIALDVGGTTVYAQATTFASSNTHNFRYTVGSGENDSDGIVLTSPLQLNTGTIRDSDSNNSSLSFTIPSAVGILVDSDPPTVLSVSPPANGTYVGSQNLNFTVTFSEPVVITGSPRIAISVGAATLYATATTTALSSTHNFRYTVANGQDDSDGILLASPINLNGGTIRDVALNNSVLTFIPPLTTGVLVDTVPSIPSSLTLVTPSSSPGVSATPTVQVGGVSSGDTITLYSDSACLNALVSGVASGTTVNLTTASLAIGDYTFYARATNSVPLSSDCSAATVSYTRLNCPVEYVPVAKNIPLGAPYDFCVMKYEAKNVAGIATSQPASIPWISITQTAAKTACTSRGTGYDLISNPEWMAVAYDIEKTSTNWSTGTVGLGALFRGHTDELAIAANDASRVLSVTDTADYYNGTGNNSGQAMGSGREQKRVFHLSNGEVIWDFAGNVWEWTDWSRGGALTGPPTSCTLGWTDFPLVNASCPVFNFADYLPGNPALVTDANYNSNYGLGKFYGVNGSIGGAARRGGAWYYGVESGVFSLSVNFYPSFTRQDGGFRCVFRPEEI